MVNVNLLNAQIVAVGKKPKDVYTALGLTRRQWYTRMKKATLNSDEMYELVKLLDIKNPIVIFFAD